MKSTLVSMVDASSSQSWYDQDRSDLSFSLHIHCQCWVSSKLSFPILSSQNFILSSPSKSVVYSLFLSDFNYCNLLCHASPEFYHQNYSPLSPGQKSLVSWTRGSGLSSTLGPSFLPYCTPPNPSIIQRFSASSGNFSLYAWNSLTDHWCDASYLTWFRIHLLHETLQLSLSTGMWNKTAYPSPAYHTCPHICFEMAWTLIMLLK